MAELNDIAAGIMEHLCTHDWHGYTQGDRWGDGEYETINVCGNDYVIATGDRDCSSAVIDSWRHALIGTEYEGRLDGATYTGNMRSVFVNSGLFEWMPMSYIAQRGDIYLNEQCHTAMCTCPDPDELAEFSISENGTIYGQVGDQTGWESHICNYYDYPWNGILRYVGNANIAPSAPATSLADLGDVTVTYCSKVNGSWLPEVVNFNNENDDGFAGIPCNSMSAFAVKVDKGSVKYRAHMLGGDWLPWVTGYDINDHDNGYAGDGTNAIDGGQIYFYTPDGYKYQQAWYRSQTVAREGWLDVVCDDSDFAGIYGEGMDRLQIRITDHNPF